jgi:hypothetical protein
MVNETADKNTMTYLIELKYDPKRMNRMSERARAYHISMTIKPFKIHDSANGDNNPKEIRTTIQGTVDRRPGHSR